MPACARPPKSCFCTPTTTSSRLLLCALSASSSLVDRNKPSVWRRERSRHTSAAFPCAQCARGLCSRLCACFTTLLQDSCDGRTFHSFQDAVHARVCGRNPACSACVSAAASCCGLRRRFFRRRLLRRQRASGFVPLAVSVRPSRCLSTFLPPPTGYFCPCVFIHSSLQCFATAYGSAVLSALLAALSSPQTAAGLRSYTRHRTVTKAPPSHPSS